MVDERVYLGDGLYAEFDGYQVVLAANNGIRDTVTVYLEPAVLAAFENYTARLRGFIAEARASAAASPQEPDRTEGEHKS
jgi:hypothetical protein